MGKWDRFGFGCKDNVIFGICQQAIKLNGAGIHQLDIAQNVKNGDAKSGFDFEKGQVSFNTSDGDGIGFSVFHLFSNFVTGLILSQIRPN